MILTKDQERSKRNKKRVKIRKSRCIELDRTYFYTRKFNVALSLYRVLGIALYFSESFSKTAVRRFVATKALWSFRVTVVCFLEQKSNLWSPIPQ